MLDRPSPLISHVHAIIRGHLHKFLLHPQVVQHFTNCNLFPTNHNFLQLTEKVNQVNPMEKKQNATDLAGLGCEQHMCMCKLTWLWLTLLIQIANGKVMGGGCIITPNLRRQCFSITQVSNICILHCLAWEKEAKSLKHHHSRKECQIPPIPLIAVCLRGTRELGNDFSNTTHISLQTQEGCKTQMCITFRAPGSWRADIISCSLISMVWNGLFSCLLPHTDTNQVKIWPTLHTDPVMMVSTPIAWEPKWAQP
jgi:hypothetical protein